jgi:sigma-B regulation protein RsbU (phosphoserine phosphatase)
MAVKILIVEDDKNLNIMLPLILKKKKVNWEFRSAHDGVEALEVLQTYKPDLAMVDLEMPRMGGLELIRHIKADPTLSELKLAVLSASDDHELKDQVRAAGVQELWMKPIFPEILFSRITAMLG